MEAMSVYVRTQSPVNLGMQFKPRREGSIHLTDCQAAFLAVMPLVPSDRADSAEMNRFTVFLILVSGILQQ